MNKLKKQNRIKSFIFHILYPTKCPGCKRVVPKEKVWCADCYNTLIRTKHTKRCRVCFQQKEFCSCKKHPKFYLSAAAPYEYENGVKNAIIRMKKIKLEKVYDFFADEMVTTINKRFKDIEFDAIIPVPMHKSRRRMRGFNQSEVLAELISKKMGIPIDKTLLTQTENIKAQHTLKHKQRHQNVRGAYSVSQTPCFYTCVLLVDDVLTSGATLNECAKQLRIKGLPKIYCITAAKR